MPCGEWKVNLWWASRTQFGGGGEQQFQVGGDNQLSYGLKVLCKCEIGGKVAKVIGNDNNV
jgi:hypothetical protein